MVLNYINEAKDINGDSWYHQIVVDKLNEKIDKLESRISKAMKLLELSPNKKNYYQWYIRISRKRYDEIIEALEGYDE